MPLLDYIPTLHLTLFRPPAKPKRRLLFRQLAHWSRTERTTCNNLQLTSQSNNATNTHNAYTAHTHRRLARKTFSWPCQVSGHYQL